MKSFASELIRPLCIAENQFLEVLITRFSLERQGKGSKLTVQFDDETPAIWMRHAKHEIQRGIDDFERKSSRYQQRLDAFLLAQQGDCFEFDDPGFPFRYASGGALPVLRIGSEEYYCLFYRDIFPLGWNIANGGCDGRNELVNPLDAMERELREELIIVDPRSRKRYVFEGDAGKPLDHPEFAVARRFWQERFHELDLPNFHELKIPLKWLDGPDSLSVQIGKSPPATITDVFLNINARDFGIEIDKVAKIHIDEDVILCDGEITENRLVNRLVGLFEVKRLSKELKEGRTQFIPDRFFYNAVLYEGKNLRRVINENFLRHIAGVRSPQEKKEYESTEEKFDLCPVTRSIVQRYLSLQAEPVAVDTGPFDVFICFGGEDGELAEQVFRFLQQKDIKTFFSRETISHPDFIRLIDDALDSARCLVGVATKPENLRRPWPEYEWLSFQQDILNRRKSKDATLVAFVSGFNPADLPRPFRIRQWIACDLDKVEDGLQKLAKYIPH